MQPQLVTLMMGSYVKQGKLESVGIHYAVTWGYFKATW